MKSNFERVKTNDETLEKLQSNIEKAFLTQPFEKVSTIKAKLYSGQKNIVEHKLEINPSGWFITNFQGAGNVWSTEASAPTKFINLFTNSTQEYDITFFVGPKVQKQYNVQSTGGGISPGGWPNCCIDHLLVCCIDNYETANLNVVTVENSLTVCCSINLTAGSLTLPENVSYRGAIPIGGIVATFPHLTGAYATNCVNTPDSNGFVLTNGQVLCSPTSPMHGVTIPNINNDVFIKASTCSGYTGGACTYYIYTCQLPAHTHEISHTHGVSCVSLPHCHYSDTTHGHSISIQTTSDGSHGHCLGSESGGTAVNPVGFAALCSTINGTPYDSNHAHCVRRTGENGYHSGGVWYTYDTRDCFCIAFPHCHSYIYPSYANFSNWYGGGTNVLYICGSPQTFCTSNTYVDNSLCSASYLYTSGVYSDPSTCAWCHASECSTYAYCANCTWHSKTLSAHNHITCCQGAHWHGLYGCTCGVANHSHTVSGNSGTTCLGIYSTGAIYDLGFVDLTHGHTICCLCTNSGSTGLGCSVVIIPCFISAVYLMRVL